MDNRFIQQYTKVGIETGVASANPHRLILMLFEGAIDSIKNSIHEMQREAIAAKGESIAKALRIIGELDASLDMEAGKDISLNLHGVYEYISIKLVEGNLHNDPGKLDESIKLLSELKAGWEGIEGEARSRFQVEHLAVSK